MQNGGRVASDTVTVHLDTTEIREAVDAVLRSCGFLDEDGQLAALIPNMRQSAQGTLAALNRAGFVIARRTHP